ncbi:MAG: UDP-3-O-(3-hydroxymyristoyl) glucosamine N-acyltransferase [Firmicutes bacterium]|nr:UDP-3-O-(3-hydroxymyristoyl) glucosamine N-acyltransferase [Bacillota bacterium]
MKKTLFEIAELIGGSVLGNGELEITGVTNIEEAGTGQITFAVAPHLAKAAESSAGAVIIPETETQFTKPAIRVANPRIAFAHLLEIFAPRPAVKREIHPTAVIGENVRMGENTAIMAYVVIEDGAVIGDNVVIYPHVFIGADTVIGADTLIYPNVTVREGCRIGERVLLNSGAVIGGDGFGFVTIEGRHRKVPQVGNVVLEDDVEVGCNTAIDRATTGSTIVRRGTKIDNLVHIAHNDVIGENCFFVAQTGISGSVTVGNNVTFAGQAGTAGHLKIGDNCVFAARSGIISDVPGGSFFAGFPARPHAEWLRSQAALAKLPEYQKKIRMLEKRLDALAAKTEE